MENFLAPAELADYTLIHTGTNSLIYQAEVAEHNGPVVIKVFKSEHPTIEQLQLFNNEFEVTKHISSKRIRKVYGKKRINNKHALVMEYSQGTTLRQYITQGTFNLPDFLKLAINIANAVAEAHSFNIIHKDLNPGNIIVDPETKQITLIDFGISSLIDQRNPFLGNPEKLEGTLAYISPEQTGRMNRLIDRRSDIYSLGVTLYECVTGVLPFTGTDPLELVHSHIAQIPVSPASINDAIPGILSDIILKTLAKNSEDRYQSASGLKADLEKCLAAVEANENPAFSLASKDFSGRFQLSQKLYGREQEIKHLEDTYQKAVSGTLQLCLVSGYSGVGKSALINELHKSITRHNGAFVTGKFDQLQRTIPYYAFIQAFKNFVDLLLTENPDKLAYWKQHLNTALGSVGKVLTDVIPNFELIIGEQAPLRELSPGESQSRFNYAILSFVKAISTAEHPFVLFIDDLQWADAASLNILKLLCTDTDLKHLLIIGAYRDNEVDALHPLILTLKESRSINTSLSVEEVSVGNLNKPNVTSLIADALHTNVSNVDSLASLVFEKAGGNAFFVGQFLQTLVAENVLTFSFEESAWKWDIEVIKTLNITDNIVELMAGKLKKLPQATQTLLQQAACIGNKFTTHILSSILECSATQCIEWLNPAINEGLIIPSASAYKYLQAEEVPNSEEISFSFVHDRVQQASYSLIAENTRKQTHLKIGRLLLATTLPETLGDNVFTITNQLNQVTALITDAAERLSLIKLNILAGKKAKGSNAYASALLFFNTGLDLLPRDKWESMPELTFSLYTNIAECAYLNADFAQSANTIKVLHDNTAEKSQKVAIYEIEHELYKAESKFPEALAVALKTLRLLGEPLPEKPNKGHIMMAFMKSKFAIGRRKAQELAELPLMTNEEKLSAMKMLSRTGLAAYLSNPDMLPLISLKTLQLSLKYGNTDQSPHAYAIYGFILNMMGDTKQAKTYSEMSLALLQRINAPELEGKLLMVRNGLLNHWFIPLEDTIPVYLRALQIGREVGDLETIFTATLMHWDHCLFAGSSIQELAQLATDYKKLNTQNKQEQAIHAFGHYETYTNTLLNTDINVLIAIASEDTSAGFLKNTDKVGLAKTQLHLAMACYMCDLPEQALKNIAIVGKHAEAIMGLSYQWAFVYYEALVCIENYRKTNNSKLLSKAEKNLKKLKKWAVEQPATFAPKVALVQAELYSVANKSADAIAYYEDAIKLARKHAYIHDEALANELVANHYMKYKLDRAAMLYLSDAYHEYKHWGNALKVSLLEAKYPQLKNVEHTKRRGTSETTHHTSTSSMGDTLDLNTVMRASTAISGEIVLEKLLEKMIRLAIENAGAQKGCLILETNGIYAIEAVGTADNNTIRLMESLPLKDSEYIPEAIVNYVLRTRETVVLANAVEDSVFGNDTGIKAYGLKSALCLPIVNQGKLIGAMYLENNLTTGAFTQQRTEILRLLSGQAAVSIDNALLYRNLEHKVQERTLEIRHQKEIIEEKSKEITDSITYARRIQRAMLPTEEFVKQRITNSFILFKPKDVVSGDFYAFAEKDDCYVLVAADCTGHGVPGAFMSMVGHNAFTDIVEDRNITQPSLILEELNKAVRRALKQDETQTKDGMDAAIVKVSKANTTIQYAGANRPLWIIKNTEKKEVEEVKATKTAIGGHTPPDQIFENHDIVLQEGDSIYMSSDGYADQFGGPVGKKLMTKRFKEILIEIQHQSMEEQEVSVNTVFEEWRGELEQIDDVCVIGVRL